MKWNKHEYRFKCSVLTKLVTVTGTINSCQSHQTIPPTKRMKKKKLPYKYFKPKRKYKKPEFCLWATHSITCIYSLRQQLLQLLDWDNTADNLIPPPDSKHFFFLLLYFFRLQTYKHSHAHKYLTTHAITNMQTCKNQKNKVELHTKYFCYTRAY